jgi:hypothetical protein
MLFLDLINKASPDEVKYNLLHSYPLLLSQLKDPEERIHNALLGIWEELQKLVYPAIIDRNKIHWLMSWLHDALPSPLAFDKESKNKIIHLGNNSYPDGPEGIIADYVAREIQSVLSLKGLDSIKRCANCSNIFILNPASDICCSTLCLSLLSITDQINNPEYRKSFFDGIKKHKPFIYCVDILGNPRFYLN